MGVFSVFHELLFGSKGSGNYPVLPFIYLQLIDVLNLDGERSVR